MLLVPGGLLCGSNRRKGGLVIVSGYSTAIIVLIFICFVCYSLYLFVLFYLYGVYCSIYGTNHNNFGHFILVLGYYGGALAVTLVTPVATVTLLLTRTLFPLVFKTTKKVTHFHFHG